MATDLIENHIELVPLKKIPGTVLFPEKLYFIFRPVILAPIAPRSIHLISLPTLSSYVKTISVVIRETV